MSMLKLLTTATAIVTSAASLAGCPPPDTTPCVSTVVAMIEPTRETISGINPDCVINIYLNPATVDGQTPEERCINYWGGNYRPTDFAAGCYNVDY